MLLPAAAAFAALQPALGNFISADRFKINVCSIRHKARAAAATAAATPAVSSRQAAHTIPSFTLR
ncbi:hypothetical protein NE562_12785 [Butyricicoccus faecihominis]|uniref:hypothetical protein n=1 Tax=Butyricicoccus faecihominis TaxID=1712515 RepID=UPI0024788D36|nr:hypothetical protein [Butyricicoccus faecihominis]MCQ5130541.1 hypothetical protein [Butyricicoccus faecihominis]